ncbi:redoxin domain-containing protein [Paenibacillus odorifer]|nr:redoxin domain-containing protein [Paenibacillus odorifer]
MNQELKAGLLLPNIQLANWNGESFKLYNLSGKKILIFTSLHCLACIDLMPHINRIQEIYSATIVFFSTGDEIDHKEIADYFNWEFPVIAMKENEMEMTFSAKKFPYMIFADDTNKVIGGGVIHNLNDFKQYLLNNCFDIERK